MSSIAKTFERLIKLKIEEEHHLEKNAFCHQISLTLGTAGYGTTDALV